MKLEFRVEGATPSRGSYTGGTVLVSTCMKYIVVVREQDSPMGKITWLSCKRVDQLPLHDWRVKQAIKNAIVGPETEGCEIYPAESRLVDTSNQYHIFCLPKGMMFPFGYRDRLVVPPGEGLPGTVQRPFESATEGSDGKET